MDITERLEASNSFWNEIELEHDDHEPEQWWRVMCERCRYLVDKLETRSEALLLGRQHVHDQHADEEWEFRVQLLKR